jgi:hypothetical protein
MRALLSAVLLLSLGVVPATMARNLSEYQRILIPIYVENQPGAYGSLWSSRLSMMLSTPDLIEIGPLRPLCEAPCLPPPIPLNHPFAPQLFVAPGSPGTIIYVQEDAADQVTFALRLEEAARTSAAGEYLPVVREAELFTQPFRIIGIHHQEGFRATLRLYTLGGPSTTVRVSLVRSGTRTERHVPVLAQTVDIDGFDIAPGYFEARLEEIAGEDLVEGPYWLEIEPLSDDALWGFVSITNNHTNELSIVLPE